MSEAMARIRYIRETKREVEPLLFAEGWVKDENGPKRPNPFNEDDYPIRVSYRDPASGLYFSFFDAMRVMMGQRPRREEIAGRAGEGA